MNTKPRYIHISTRPQDVKLPNGSIQSRLGSTLNIGINAAKRAAREAERMERADAVARRAAGDFTVNTRKIKRTRLMVNMLANRRLRQRGVITSFR